MKIENKNRKYITVKGIVQGVGFRPYVYRLAVQNNLKGWVKNTSGGLYIDVEGKEVNVENFLAEIKNNPPKLSKVAEIYVEDRELANYEKFEIKKSNGAEGRVTLISPDIGICEDCINDIKNIENRRYKYPFTNCTNCGPRYTIIKGLPYDRYATSMSEFVMCSECGNEYENPLDRRFHAQPTACHICGPKIELVDSRGNKVLREDIIKEVVRLLKKGVIIAIKGLSGFHLACDAKCEKAVEKLRDRKNRPTKPLAVMIKDIYTVKKYCNAINIEEKILGSERKPIVLLNKKNDLLLHNIAPNNNKLGVMLPYTPLHQLIFDEGVDVLVMTSANQSGMPIIYKNDDAVESLKNVADYMLIHNRDIYIPVDDSVSMVVLGEERVLRNSRGYAPININHHMSNEILACGSHMKNSIALSKADNIFVSQYIGDVENIETYDRVSKIIEHFKSIYYIKPEVIAVDMHPNYWSSEYIKEQNIRHIEVQHHHAHIVSCMVENKVEDKVIGIAYDGSGYGTDRKIWGGEFFICNYSTSERVGHLNYLGMPGGEIVIKEPWRMAVSYLYKVYGDELDNILPESLRVKEISNLKSMLRHSMNIIDTSSVGRLFDAIAVILGFTGEVTYEGEAAIFLEYICDQNETSSYDYNIQLIDDEYIINTDNMVKELMGDINVNVKKEIIARKFHNTLIDFSVHMCELIYDKKHIKKVVLSGGVFQNQILLTGIYEKLISKGFEVYTHKLIPCNDSGISLGQLVIANEIIHKNSPLW